MDNHKYTDLLQTQHNTLNGRFSTCLRSALSAMLINFLMNRCHSFELLLYLKYTRLWRRSKCYTKHFGIEQRLTYNSLEPIDRQGFHKRCIFFTFPTCQTHAPYHFVIKNIRFWIWRCQRITPQVTVRISCQRSFSKTQLDDKSFRKTIPSSDNVEGRICVPYLIQIDYLN